MMYSIRYSNSTSEEYSGLHRPNSFSFSLKNTYQYKFRPELIGILIINFINEVSSILSVKFDVEALLKLKYSIDNFLKKYVFIRNGIFLPKWDLTRTAYSWQKDTIYTQNVYFEHIICTIFVPRSF